MATHLTTDFNLRPDIFDNITPLPWVQDNIANPHGSWRPAPYLPVVWTQTNTTRGEDAFVISTGKVVALDRQGYIVPAGLRGALDETTSTVVLTYTATDYKYKVIDLTTGLAYATNGTTSYTAIQVAIALVERGLVPEDTVSNNPPSSNADVTAIVKAFISKPVGVAYSNMYKWGGLAEEGNQAFANYQLQHAVQFVTEKQMKVPHRVASDTTADAFDVSAVTAKTAASAAGDFPQPGEIWLVGGLEDLARYDLEGTEPIVAFTLANKPVAKNTDRTPISCDLSAVLLKEKTSIKNIKKAGDWYLDGEVGLLFVHEDTYDTLVADDTDPTFSYSYYDDAATGASSEHFIYFDGECRPGDFVSVDEKSNFVVKGTAGDILDSTDPALGRVYFTWKEPREMLDQVKTSWNVRGMPASGKMPGTATKGYSDMITLAEEPVADSIVVLSVRI